MTSPDGGDLTIDEIARHLRTSRWSVGRAIKAGELTAIRVPGKGRDGSKRIPLKAYLTFLDHCAITAEPDEDPAMTDNPPAGLPRLYPFEEVAEHYGWPLGELKKLTYGDNPKISFTRVGRRLYFTPEQFDAFLRRQARRPNDGLDGVRARRARRTTRNGSQRAARSAA